MPQIEGPGRRHGTQPARMSSLALVMIARDEARCIEVASEDCDMLRLRWAFNDTTLVLIVIGMKWTPISGQELPAPLPAIAEVPWQTVLP